MRSLVDLFVPRRIVSAHLDSFTAAGQKVFWPGLAVYFGLPLVAGGVCFYFGWTFLVPLTTELLTAVTLIGSVLVAISAVLVQGIFTEANAPGHATNLDRRRIGALRNVHGTIAYGALASFLLAALLVWLVAVTSEVPFVGLTQGEALLHAAVFALLVHVGLALLRVMIVSDLVVEAYARRAQNRAA